MKKSIFLLGVFSLLIFSACSNDEESVSTEVTSLDSTMTTPVQSFEATDSLGQTNNIQTTTFPPASLNTPTMSSPVSGGKGMNPAHGEPGHRCEIPVGAPLDSKPTNTVQEPGRLTPAPQSLTMPPVNSTSAPSLNAPMNLPSPTPNAVPVTGSLAEGTNPAHGEPGHDCAIPVGAPLKKDNAPK